MIRVGDIVHTFLFAVCIAGGALVFHLVNRSALQGMGFGLVTWVVLMLLYMTVQRFVRPAKVAQEPEPVVEDDDTAFEIEDGKDD